MSFPTPVTSSTQTSSTATALPLSSTTPLPTASSQPAALLSSVAALPIEVALAQPAQALPKIFKVEDIVRETHAGIVPARATPETIAQRVEEKDYPGLLKLFQQHVVAEYNDQKYNLEIRKHFLQAVLELQAALKPTYQNTDFNSLSPVQKQEYKFVTDSITFEAHRIFARFLLPLGAPVAKTEQNPAGVSILDPEMPNFSMKSANEEVHVRIGYRLLGTDTVIQTPGSFTDGKKANVKMDQPLLIPTYKASFDYVVDFFKQRSEKTSQVLQKLFPEIKGDFKLYIRGAIGHGKSSALAELGLNEQSIGIASDAIKPMLGGNPAHHLASRAADAVRTHKVAATLDMRTNTSKKSFDEELGKVIPGVQKIVIDVYGPSVEATIERVKTRGGRLTDPQQVKASVEESSATRPLLIAKAAAEPSLTWILQDNSEGAKLMSKVAMIQDKKLTILNPERFAAILAQDAALNAALQAAFPKAKDSVMTATDSV